MNNQLCFKPLFLSSKYTPVLRIVIQKSRDDLNDVHGLEDLSLINFPQEILHQYIFRSELFLQ